MKKKLLIVLLVSALVIQNGGISVYAAEGIADTEQKELNDIQLEEHEPITDEESEISVTDTDNPEETEEKAPIIEDSSNEAEAEKKEQIEEEGQEEDTQEDQNESGEEPDRTTQIESYAVSLNAVVNLKAVSAGKNKIKLTWDKVQGATEYIIYRQIGKINFQYRYITSNLSYVDMTASGIEYNYYRVYPCVTDSSGKRTVGPSNAYVFAKALLPEAVNVKAVAAGKNKVKLAWSKVTGADGYLIYRQVGKGTYAYRYMTSNLSYIDTTASDTEYNFYWVFPYYNQENMISVGLSGKYVFALGVLTAVTGLKAQTIGKTIKLTWNKVAGAEGYLIYRQEGKDSFKYLYMKDASATSYVDAKCSALDYNYYRVYPYHKKGAKIIPGLTDKYVYGAITLEPVTEMRSRVTGFNQITLRWTKATGAEGYYIIRSIGKENAVILEQVQGGDTTKYVDHTASTINENYYAVISYIVDGKGQTIVTKIQTSSDAGVAVANPGNITSTYITGLEAYNDAYKVLELVNKERQAAGLGTLVMDKDLMDAAMQRAAELVVLFDHVRPSGLGCATADVKIWGENIAMGTYPMYNADEIMNGWMNSPGHRANILGNGYTSIGIGAFRYNGIQYWVQLFGDDMIVTTSQPQNRTVTRVIEVSSSLKNEVYTMADGAGEVQIGEGAICNMEEAVKSGENMLQLPSEGLEGAIVIN